VLVIFAVSLVALILFVGLAVDAGSVYVTYGQLKRAVDSAAVAAANDIKKGAPNTATLKARMTDAAREVLKLHNVDLSTVDVTLYMCDENDDNIRDASLATAVPAFYNRCPNTPVESARKLVWVEATQHAPLYFLSLLGIGSVDLHTNSIAEAATVDVVIVLDTSESMGTNSADYQSNPALYVDNYDPANCNAANNCQPLRQAKDAAKALIDTLYGGFDQAAIVSFDSVAHEFTTRNLANTKNVRLSDNFTAVKSVIDNSVRLHDDPPYARMWPNWKIPPASTYAGYKMFNPVNPEDRDGDGSDTDTNFWPACNTSEDNTGGNTTRCCVLNDSHWDDTKDPYGWGGIPCDDPNKKDAYNWDGDGDWTWNDSTDQPIGDLWTASHPGEFESPLSTCTGCGIKKASEIFKAEGRPGAVWVMVFLSDGYANLSMQYPDTTHNYVNGFCQGSMGYNWWKDWCTDTQVKPATRRCIDTDQTQCPPNSIYDVYAQPKDMRYSTMDWAYDMVDELALTYTGKAGVTDTRYNLNEPHGNDVAVYSIFLGGVNRPGIDLLRYLAAVGDDGDRVTDPCSGVALSAESCGQFYRAPTGGKLMHIFEEIATRIYTRITD
jgi:hypothetical protein